MGQRLVGGLGVHSLVEVLRYLCLEENLQNAELYLIPSPVFFVWVIFLCVFFFSIAKLTLFLFPKVSSSFLIETEKSNTVCPFNNC